MQKHSPRNCLPSSRNRQKTEILSLGYDVNDHVYSNQNPSNLVRI